MTDKDAARMEPGLTEKEAADRLLQHGYNELPSADQKSVLDIVLGVIREPMFILLLACGTVYLLLGDYSEGVILLSWVLVIISITFWQHRKTEKSLEALKQLSSPRALVIRDGKEVRIPGREVVPGDILLLHEGDRVPADAQVLESEHLTLDESLLTGESAPVLKTDQAVSEVYSGTLVVQGKGMARVVRTGVKTSFGKIGVSLKSIEPDGTRLQREMKSLIRNLFLAGAVLSIGVVAAFYFTRGNLLNAVLNGLAASMALLPEEFPVVLTIFLALGAWRMTKNKVLTRKPSAIETLGSATVLCSDKTGTITQNNMEIAALQADDQTYFKASFETDRDKISELLRILYHASQGHSIDPMEKAITKEYVASGTANEPLKAVRDYPLGREVMAMTRVFPSQQAGQFRAYCKGAPEAVFKLSGMIADKLADCSASVHQLAGMGYRVLAAAQCEWNEPGLPEKQSGFPFVFAGLVAFEDPVRPEVPAAIRDCSDAGIKVIMITGDYPETARSIARQIGLPNAEQVLTGAELEQMEPDVLRERMKDTHVFARIVPEQKLQIIRALKANGEVVAMTGDGVNDAPALKAADIGVAMGLKGTDVAREASSLVLLDDNFASVVQAIRSGRRIFDNLQKAMSYIIAIHIPIIGLVLIPAFFSWLPVLLMPLHIVFMELIIDPVCAIVFESEQEEKGIMNRPPRKPDALFFGWRNMLFSVFKGLALFAMVTAVYFLSLGEGHSEGEVRAIAFSSLIIGNVFMILTSLSDTRNALSIFFEKNKAVLLTSTLALSMLLLSITVEPLKKVFGFEFPGYGHFTSAIVAAVLMLLLFEGIKGLRLLRKKKIPG